MSRHFIYILFSLATPFLYGQDLLNITLLDSWQDNSIITNSSEARYNDCWGYVQNDQEYAILGSTEGTHFFEIDEYNSLNVIDFKSGKFNSSSVIHRDIKVFQNYAYVVCDEGESSLQIFDLSYLPDSVHLVAENDTSFARVHNLFIDADNELMYACLITPKINGVLQNQKSMEVYSISNPINPTLIYTGPSDIPEVHDAYVRNNIAYLNCGFDGIRVYDFTNPASPIFLQNIDVYQEQGYNHQGWLSPDGRSYVFGDETNGKKLKMCSVQNNSLLIENTFGTSTENGSVPHNIMLSNEFAYVAYYNEGLRIYDLRSSTPKEIAFFDTYTEDNPFKMNGAWGVFTDYPSGNILVSDRQNGLFLLDFNEEVFLDNPLGNLSIYPNPVTSGENLTVKIDIRNVTDFAVELTAVDGKSLQTMIYQNQTYAEFSIANAAGVYFLHISYIDYLGNLQKETRKLLLR